MGQTDKTRAALLAAVVVTIVVLALSLVVHGPVWVWAAVMVAGDAIAVLIAVNIVHRREQAELRAIVEQQKRAQIEEAEAQPPEPPAHVQYPLSAIPLPSAETDYRVLLSATVCWRQTEPKNSTPHASPVDLAVNWILTRARELTVLEKPEDVKVVQHRLAVALGTPLAEPYGHVIAWAVDVKLVVSDEDERRLARLAELRKHERMWDQERRMEVSMRRYLSEDVLKDTGSAVVWWLARHTDQIEDSARMIGHLAQLTAAANSKDLPAPEMLKLIQAIEPNGHQLPSPPPPEP